MRRLWEYVDGELPQSEVAQLREHLAVCARCSPQYRFQLGFLALVARAAAAARPRRELAERIRSALASVEP
jgi:anti-sigma factor RsiW